jgi:hypothetical protein
MQHAQHHAISQDVYSHVHASHWSNLNHPKSIQPVTAVAYCSLLHCSALPSIAGTCRLQPAASAAPPAAAIPAGQVPSTAQPRLVAAVPAGLAGDTSQLHTIPAGEFRVLFTSPKLVKQLLSTQ